MSKRTQSGILQLMGQTQSMIIYRKRNGEYGFRKKGGVTSERMANDPNYEAARLNARDFAQAGKAGLLIKRAFTPMIPKQANSDVYQRLTRLCKAVIKSDLAHERGNRHLSDGDTGLFSGFEFSSAASFSNTVLVPYRHRVNRGEGTVRVDLPAYIPEDMIIAPEKATHCRLKLGVAALNFGNATHTCSFARSAYVQLGEIPAAPQILSASIPANTADPIFIALAIEFVEEEGDVHYPIRNSRFSLMKLVAVDVPA